MASEGHKTGDTEGPEDKTWSLLAEFSPMPAGPHLHSLSTSSSAELKLQKG